MALIAPHAQGQELSQRHDQARLEALASSKRSAMRPIDRRSIALNPVQPNQTLADQTSVAHSTVTRLRPSPRIIDATESPIVAVMSGVQPEATVELADGPDDLPEPPAPSGAETAEYPTVPAPRQLGQLTVQQALQMRGSVSFRKTPISEVVFLLSDLWKINIVAGADVTGEVSGAFQDAPLSEVLSATLTASGYGYRQMGNALVVLPIDQISIANPGTTSAGGFSQAGIAYFTPQFIEAEQMAQPLQIALGEGVVIAVYPEGNRIMVKGTPDDLRLATEAIQQLDVPRPQVRITAMIYDVSLGELERLGFDWNREVRQIANATDEALADVTQTYNEFFAAAADLTTNGVTSVGLRTINDSLNASVFLEALDTTSEAKLLADPSITVGDRTEASIRIVQQIPIVGANPVAGSNAVFTQTEFKEAGVILVVTPRISRDGTIEMRVSPEYSRVTEITPNGPVIDTRTADTIVRVNDGQMFVLGGLRQKSVVESVRGVPYLRDIKYVGRLFRNHATEVRESELIVFLKPELITPYYSGHPREQMAACVASDQLDRIPHAVPGSIIPDCGDCLCPNHHPRTRINGGSYSLEMFGGTGFGPYEVIETQPIEILSDDVQAAPAAESATVPKSLSSAETPPAALETTVVEELHPPVYVDTRAVQRSVD